MKKESHHTEEFKARMRGRMTSQATRERLRFLSLQWLEAKRKAEAEAKEASWQFNYERHYEPGLTPEVVHVQDRMLARYGRGGGKKAERQPQTAPDKFRDYGMRVCRGCGTLQQTDFFDCTNCDGGKAVINR